MTDRPNVSLAVLEDRIDSAPPQDEKPPHY